MSIKKCTKCGVVKALTEFHKRAAIKSGYRANCKQCGCAYRRCRYPETRERDAIKYKEWVANNRGRKNALVARRRAQKIQATPAWADQAAIKSLYEEAQRLQDLLGIEFHIDHVLPLQGELVCGLHVETNLQVVPATLNLKKSNKFEVQ